jgi:hypothetical protein
MSDRAEFTDDQLAAFRVAIEVNLIRLKTVLDRTRDLLLALEEIGR